MIEIKKEQAEALYSEIKNMILSRNYESTYHYEKQQHHLYEQDVSPEIQAKFYNESGSIHIKNVFGEIIVIEVNRWHAHKHNGWSGLNSIPCLLAIIYIKENKEEKNIWELSVVSGTLYYKAEITNFEIPISNLVNENFDLSEVKYNEYFKEEQNEKSKVLLKVLKHSK